MLNYFSEYYMWWIIGITPYIINFILIKYILVPRELIFRDREDAVITIMSCWMFSPISIIFIIPMSVSHLILGNEKKDK